MHRFYLPPAQCDEATLFLSGSEAHHALRVLRIKRAEQVVVLDGAGRELLCEVKGYDRDKVELRVTQKRSFPPPPCQITLLQAVPKGKIIEAIIQKATELGAFSIVPLLSERAVVQLTGKEAAQKAAKWQGVAVEAIKQCGAPWLPRVEPPMTPRQFLARKQNFELPLIASLESDARHARQYFGAFQADHARLPHSICIWVGPEGDFTPSEMTLAKAEGALPITLGPLVLRVETAAVYCMSILNYELRAPAS